MRESDLELSICHYLRLKHRDLFFWKQTSRGFYDTNLKRFRRDRNPYCGKGIPDLILIYKGRFIGLEIKTPKGSQTPDQREFERKLRSAGGRYYVIRSLGELEQALNEIREEFNGT